MALLTVVEDQGSFEDQVARISAVPLSLMQDQFHLEGGEKALHCGVVPAFPLVAHVLERLQALQDLSILTIIGGCAGHGDHDPHMAPRRTGAG